MKRILLKKRKNFIHVLMEIDKSYSHNKSVNSILSFFLKKI